MDQAIIEEQSDPTELSSNNAAVVGPYRLVLTTQLYENYGTHACEHESDEACDCHPYWKAKGGSEYHQ